MILPMLLALAAAAPPPPCDAEMTAIYAADQRARAHVEAITDWNGWRAADAVRLHRTRALLDGGRLACADDWYHAAYVFQHGYDPADYLTAHALAIVAIARGKGDATRIAAMSLDRYLQSIGRPQVYGTQLTRKPHEHATRAPYDPAALPDSVRVATGIPPVADQGAELAAFDRMMAGK